MDQLKIFENPEFGKIRTVAIEGEPWLVGKDVALALGYKNHRQALATNVDEEDRGVHSVDSPSGTQQMTIINESGLYSLVLSSKLPEAKKFRRWVTSEVLPSIRKQGAYLSPAVEEKLTSILAEFQSLSDRVTALETSLNEPLAFAVPALLAPPPEEKAQETQPPGRDYLKRWMRTASEKLNLMSSRYNMSNNAILHRMYGFLEAEFGVVLADERIRIMEEYGLDDCSTLKAVFYDEEFREYLEDCIDHNLAPENRGW